MIACFFRFTRFNTISDSAMMIIPVMESASGFSPGNRIQLKMAPESGIRNFHRFRSETFIPGLLSRVIQIEMPTAC